MLSKMQASCVDEIVDWYKQATNQYFVLAGYAGVGKTYIIQYAAEKMQIPLDEIAFVTFTGKAALVVTQKAGGKFECHTLHHTLYELVENGSQVSFKLRNKSDFAKIKLFVVDESSMVPRDILDDLLSIGKPILFVGDHGQLEPIGEKTWLYERLQNADFTLTEIHRQAEGNQIIHLSMLAREGKKIDLGKYGKDAWVVPKRKLKTSKGLQKSLLSADQIICGYNKTRHKYNSQIREQLGYTSDYPQKGDKLICLRNNWRKSIADCSLVNGLIGYADNVKSIKKGGLYNRDHIRLTFQPDFTDNRFSFLRTLPNYFEGGKVDLERSEYGDYDTFDFGYAITCHKAQGSQWDNVIVINEAFGDDPNRWLYTAITRAGKKLILAK